MSLLLFRCLNMSRLSELLPKWNRPCGREGNGLSEGINCLPKEMGTVAKRECDRVPRAGCFTR